MLPIIYDSAGKSVLPEELMDVEKFPGYTAYTNSQIQKHIQSILDATQGKAIILLISDHGLKLKNEFKQQPRNSGIFFPFTSPTRLIRV